MLTTRPKIAELVFQLYGRSLHPELFEVYRTLRVRRGDPETSGYEAKIEITSAGHVVTWRRGKLILSEIATSSHQPLPKKRRLISERIDGEQTEGRDCRGGVRYEVTFALDTVTPEAFAAYQQELDLAQLQSAQSPAKGASQLQPEPSAMVHRFDTSGRVGLGAMSYVSLQSRDHSLRVQALHTFPDDCAIVRSQSLFRLPS